MMGNRIKRISALIMALVLPAAAFAACGGKNDDTGGGGGGGKNNTPSQAEEMAAALGYVYVPEYFNLPAEAGDSYDMCYHDGMLYFTYYDYSAVNYPDVMPEGRAYVGKAVSAGVSTSSGSVSVSEDSAGEGGGETDGTEDDGDTEASEETGGAEADEVIGGDTDMGIMPEYSYQAPEISLMRVGIDGTGLEKLAYEPTKLEDGVQGDVGVQRIWVDAEGSIWVMERVNAYHYDADGNYMSDGENYYMKKLDSNGAEISVVDLTFLKDKSESEYFYINQAASDSEGNVYVTGENAVYVIDPNGEFLFTAEVSNWIQSFVTLGDGSIAVYAYEERGQSLKTIDVAAKGWGKDYPIPSNIYNTYSGNADFDFIYSNNSSLFGYDLETGESQRLINWISSDVNSDYVNSIVPLEDGRILCVSRDWSVENGKTELIIFSKKDASEVQTKTSLTLACMWLDQNIKAAVLEFNKTNPNYRIDVKDYSEYNDYSSDDESAWNAGLTKLTTEIISGTVPDMLMTSTELPMVKYVSKGLLEDLYPYIDADPDLGRDKLIESVLRAMEISGGLYEAAPSFNVMTVVGRAEDVGTEMGWTMDDLTALLASKPEGTMAFANMMRDTIMQYSLIMEMQNYVDWETGKCSFDTEDFIKVLEFAKTFPAEIDWEKEEYVSESQMIMSGQVLLSMFYANDLEYFQMYKAMFGGDITFIGYPSSTGIGSVFNISSGISMSSSCKDKDAAWSFIRTLLTEEYQTSDYMWNFPTNRASFDTMMERAMEEETYIDENGEEQVVSKGTWGWEDLTVEIYASTQEEVDQIKTLIDATTSTMRYDMDMFNIVTEEAAPFFAGQKSAMEVATIIQGRVTTYVNEQR